MKKCRKGVSFGISKDGKKNRKGRIQVWPGEVAQRAQSLVFDSLQPRGLEPTRLLRPWDFPGKNTGVGCHFLLQGIFPTQVLRARLGMLLWRPKEEKPCNIWISTWQVSESGIYEGKGRQYLLFDGAGRKWGRKGCCQTAKLGLHKSALQRKEVASVLWCMWWGC